MSSPLSASQLAIFMASRSAPMEIKPASAATAVLSPLSMVAVGFLVTRVLSMSVTATQTPPPSFPPAVLAPTSATTAVLSPLHLVPATSSATTPMTSPTFLSTTATPAKLPASRFTATVRKGLAGMMASSKLGVATALVSATTAVLSPFRPIPPIWSTTTATTPVTFLSTTATQAQPPASRLPATALRGITAASGPA